MHAVGLSTRSLFFIGRRIKGCSLKTDGKKTLVDSDKKVYWLLDGGPSQPVGEHVELTCEDQLSLRPL
jgi:hypothetical protein